MPTPFQVFKAIDTGLGVAANLAELFSGDSGGEIIAELGQIKSQLTSLTSISNGMVTQLEDIQTLILAQTLSQVQTKMDTAIDGLQQKTAAGDAAASTASKEALSLISNYMEAIGTTSVEKSVVLPTLVAAINVRRGVIDQAEKGNFARIAEETGVSTANGDQLIGSATLLYNSLSDFQQEFWSDIQVVVGKTYDPVNPARDITIQTNPFTDPWSPVTDIYLRSESSPSLTSQVFQVRTGNIPADWVPPHYEYDIIAGLGQFKVPVERVVFDVHLETAEDKFWWTRAGLTPESRSAFNTHPNDAAELFLERVYKAGGGDVLRETANDLVELTWGTIYTPPAGDTSADDTLESDQSDGYVAQMF